MNTTKGGTKVKGGFYWNRTDWDMTVIPVEGGTLPGGAERTYTRVPMLALLFLGPLAGGVYVVSLPVVGLYFLGKNLYRLASGAAGRAHEAREAKKAPRH